MATFYLIVHIDTWTWIGIIHVHNHKQNSKNINHLSYFEMTNVNISLRLQESRRLLTHESMPFWLSAVKFIDTVFGFNQILVEISEYFFGISCMARHILFTLVLYSTTASEANTTISWGTKGRDTRFKLWLLDDLPITKPEEQTISMSMSSLSMASSMSETFQTRSWPSQPAERR